jgi:hypothetical protein
MTTRNTETEAKSKDAIVDLMAGSCAVGYLDCSIVEFARGVKFFIDQEGRSLRCDTHLVNVLRRAACAAWELANASGPGLAARIAEARRDERDRAANIADEYAREDPDSNAPHIASAIRGKSK